MNGVLGLLHLICQSLFQKATKRNPAHTFIDSAFALCSFIQSKNMTNIKYKDKLISLIDIYKELRVEPGYNTARLKSKSPICLSKRVIKSYLIANASPLEQAVARQAVQKEFIVVMMIVKIDPNQYQQMIADAHNRHLQRLQTATRLQLTMPTTSLHTINYSVKITIAVKILMCCLCPTDAKNKTLAVVCIGAETENGVMVVAVVKEAMTAPTPTTTPTWHKFPRSLLIITTVLLPTLMHYTQHLQSLITVYLK